eukprot:Seg16364.2 transcript_id=Seg16364.2/GoldUCD/mRNA.D3Y31 product="UPF0761 membrane protein azo3165" protein_id=Seg16364.2/GoldUCD/D3Y31
MHKHADAAAALAFYSLISLVPILVVGMNVASWIVGDDTARASLLEGTSSIAGTKIGEYFAQLISKDVKWFGSGISPILGTAFMAYAATKVIAELRSLLDNIFGKPEQPSKRHAVTKLMSRGFSMFLLLVLGLLIASAVVVETIIGLIQLSIEDSDVLLTLASWFGPLISFAATVYLATIAMRLLPKRRPKFREAVHGGILSASLLLILKLGLTAFLNNANVGSFYGSALTLVIVLFWIYFAMQVFLLGAEYTAIVAKDRRDALADMDEPATEEPADS